MMKRISWSFSVSPSTVRAIRAERKRSKDRSDSATAEALLLEALKERKRLRIN
jgi:hypothetical protein